MNAGEFVDIGYYFQQSLKLVVYAYEKIKQDKAQEPYSRNGIYQTAVEVRMKWASFHGKKDTVNKRVEIEDPLRTDMVDNYLEKLKHRFKLEYFSSKRKPLKQRKI